MSSRRTLRRTKERAGAPKADSRPSAGARRADGLAILILVVVCFAVFANGLRGDFVYDDTKQIAGNDLIQQNRYLGKALVSDVWAFKGEKGEAWSNYWRPAFVLWLVLNDRLFGVENTVGWHVACVLLHALVCGLAYLVVRRLDVSAPVALASALLFAVHPAHVESVTWISGSGDVVLAAAFLACLLCLFTGRRLGAMVFFGCALAAKEVAVLLGLVLLVALHAMQPAGESSGRRLRAAARAAIPFAVLTAIYVGLHFLVIGKARITAEGSPGALTVALTAPSLLLFYLRDALLPFWIAPVHSLRAITPEQPGMTTFFLPAIGVTVALVFLFRIGRRTAVGRVGLALFLIPLLPTLDIRAFVAEQLVQDRYLYLPVLGLAMTLIPALATWLGRRMPERDAAKRTLGIVVVVALAFAVATVRTNPVWCSERALWTAAVEADPTSSFSLVEYARVMKESGRLSEADAALGRALAIRPLTTGYLQRAEIAMTQAESSADPVVRRRRLDAAAADLALVLASQPDNFAAYERLAVVEQNAGRLDEAERTLRTAIAHVPYRKAALTDMLAVILYAQGRKDEALAELEGARALAETEVGGAVMLFFHLGSLYAEMGRDAAARDALQKFLSSSENLRDPITLASREQARTLLGGTGR